MIWRQVLDCRRILIKNRLKVAVRRFDLARFTQTGLG